MTNDKWIMDHDHDEMCNFHSFWIVTQLRGQQIQIQIQRMINDLKFKLSTVLRTTVPTVQQWSSWVSSWYQQTKNCGAATDDLAKQRTDSQLTSHMA